jgi:N-acetylmuramoyl-L-alanine amidase
MRFVVVTALALTLSPGTALASGASLTTQEVPLRGERSLAAARAPVFDLVGLHWRGPGSVSFRTRSVSGRWTAWRPARPEDEDLPDPSRREGLEARGWRLGNPYWVGPSNRIEYRLRGRVDRLRAHFVRSAVEAVPARSVSIAGSPKLVSRLGWNANESIRRGAPEYAPAVRFAVVHHTAGSNSYTAAGSAAIVRAIQVYHVRGNGWKDVGYNFLVDKFGQVFEGRFGGVERPVVGAHAEGFNTGSTGVALLGNYSGTAVSAKAQAAIARLIAWRLDVAHVDPLGSLIWQSGGNPRYPAGAPVSLRVVSGHRDTGFTSCPGGALYRRLGALARTAAAEGAPKLFDPAVVGRLGGLIRFTGRLSAPIAWTVTVRDEAGATVGIGTGTGPTVDWTWDASLASPARYTWAIEAGQTVRPASGAFGARATLAMTNVSAKPSAITPNGDSVADVTTISYTLSVAATVTATLRDAFGAELAVLFTGQRRAGKNTFRFTADGIPDGSYTIALVARTPNGREVRTEVPIVIDRTLAALAVKPAVFSPNGDGRVDRTEVSFVLAAPAAVEVRFERSGTEPVIAFTGPLDPGPQRVEWNQPLPDGRYRVVVSAEGPLGRRMLSARLAADTKPPELRVVSVRELRFVLSEPATLVMTVDGRPLVRKVGAGRVRVGYPSAVTRLTVRAWDAAGNRSPRLRYP